MRGCPAGGARCTGRVALLTGLAAALLAASVACTSRREAPPGPGHRLVAGEVLALRPSPDGRWLAFLHRCRPEADRTLPPGTASCELAVVPSAGGEPVAVAKGVTTLPAGFAWAAKGSVLAALRDYAPETGTGTLVAWSDASPRPETMPAGARLLSAGVSYYAFDPGSALLAWTSPSGPAGLVHLPQGEAAPVRAVMGSATVELAGGAALFRRGLASGSELWLVTEAGRRGAKKVATGVRDYRFAPGGARFAYTQGDERTLVVSQLRGGKAASLGSGVRDFVFAPRGEGLAWLSARAPGRPAEVWALFAAGEAAARLGERASELRWSAGGERLAWLDAYDAQSRTGKLMVAGPGEGPLAVASNVSDYALSPDGMAVAYLVHETAGGLSVDLGLARLDRPAPAPAKSSLAPNAPPEAGARVARGVFGFGFSPDGRWLYYRNACVREAEACDLFRVPGDGAGAAAPQAVAQGVKSWECAPGRPGRLLLGWSRTDRVALDLALWEEGKLIALDTVVRPGSAGFVGGDPTRLAWAVLAAKREGVHVAEVP